MKKTTNIRACESQERVVNAFLMLLKTEKYCDISITQIVQEAKLSRKTFYRNFHDKADVLNHLSNLLFLEFRKKLKNISELTNYKIIESYFSFWYDKREILEIFYYNNLIYLIFEIHLEKIKLLYLELPCYTELPQNSYKNSVIIGSCFGMLMQWLKDGFTSSDEQTTSTYIEIMKGLGESFIFE